MKHLSEANLALAARGDLPLASRLWARVHCLLCEACRRRVADYQSDPERVRRAVTDFTLPRAMRWDELEAEMFANIRIGVDVNEIGHSMKPAAAEGPWFSWRGAAAVAALSLTVITGWMLGGPGAKLQMSATAAQVQKGSLILRGDATGIGMVNNNKGLILRNVSAPAGRFEVGLDGSMRTSTVDESSGQVTVSQMYVE